MFIIMAHWAGATDMLCCNTSVSLLTNDWWECSTFAARPAVACLPPLWQVKKQSTASLVVALTVCAPLQVPWLGLLDGYSAMPRTVCFIIHMAAAAACKTAAVRANAAA